MRALAFASTLMLLFTAAPATAEDALRVMVPELRCPDRSVDAGAIEAITGLTVLQLSKVKRFKVVSGAEIAEMLKLEADRQRLGCDESESCLSEIADAMDARLLVTGTVARIGPRTVVNLSLIDSSTVEVVGRSGIDVRDPEQMPYEVKRAVHELSSSYGGIPGYAPPVEQNTSVARFVAKVANHPDAAMLFCTTGMAACSSVLVCLPCVPLAQGALLWLGGKEIAGREYPLWWLGVCAGYSSMLVGVAAGAALVGVGGWFAANPLLNATFAFGGGALVFGSIFVLEPLAMWGTSLLLAKDWQPDEEEAAAPATPQLRQEPALPPAAPTTSMRY